VTQIKKEIEMIGIVYLVNVRGIYGVENALDMVYVGRKCGRFENSILGNYVGKGFDREEAINRFRDYLWVEFKKKGEVFDELIKIRDRLLNGEDIWLGCWCKPKNCHSDVIKSCLEWMIDNMD
jgi:hypothetical protein